MLNAEEEVQEGASLRKTSIKYNNKQNNSGLSSLIDLVIDLKIKLN